MEAATGLGKVGFAESPTLDSSMTLTGYSWLRLYLNLGETRVKRERERINPCHQAPRHLVGDDVLRVSAGIVWPDNAGSGDITSGWNAAIAHTCTTVQEHVER